MSLELAPPPEITTPEEEPEGVAPSTVWPPTGNYASSPSAELIEAGNQAFVQAEICEQLEGNDSPYTQALYKVAGKYLIEANIVLELEDEKRNEDDVFYSQRLIRIGQSLAKQAATDPEEYSDPVSRNIDRKEYLLGLAQSYALRALTPRDDPNVTMAGGVLPTKTAAEIVLNAAESAHFHPRGLALADQTPEKLEAKGTQAVVDIMDGFKEAPDKPRLTFVLHVLDRTEEQVARATHPTSYELAA